jgi:hypothetical protein
LAHFSFFCIQDIADINKNIIARAMTMGIVNFKKIGVGKKRDKDFWFCLKRMYSFSIFLNKVNLLSMPVKESVALS